MKKFLIGAGALLAATAAVAQVAPQPPMAPRDGIRTRAEVVQQVRTMFARMDANRDGVLTQDEQKMGKGRERMAERGADPARRQQMFDRLDTNRDNMISRDEFARADAMRGERGPRGQGREHRMGMKGMHGGMMRRADANNDQRLTLAEAEAAALQRFDRADVNRDGRITQDERQQMRQQWQQRRPQAAPAPAPVR
ncbi:EF-hand domain-containing protein [Sphingomonas astaxanthinifaciens]|uniref:EF-hand domain-containing protein n=1 Tax=Sphingomonas astaxanthinifaciens TaxID=407019 RepID=UPI0004A7507F|nr:EF-hand domain-containing protein [Sphingomonas astaxanthinifaciens]